MFRTKSSGETPEGLDAVLERTGEDAGSAPTTTSAGSETPAAGADQASQGSHPGGDGSDTTPTTDDLAPSFLNDAYAEMAARRKRQVQELRAKNAELESFRAAFLQRAPAIQKQAELAREQATKAQQLEEQLAEATFQLEQAKSGGFQPQDMETFQKDRRQVQLERKVDMLLNLTQQARQAGQVQGAPSAAPPMQADPAYNREAATNYFLGQFAELATSIPGLERFQQDICNRWWLSGGQISVEDAAQDHIDEVAQRKRAEAQAAAATAATMPRTGNNPVRRQAPPRQPAQQPPQRQPQAYPPDGRQVPRGLDAVAAQHLRTGSARPQ